MNSVTLYINKHIIVLYDKLIKFVSNKESNLTELHISGEFIESNILRDSIRELKISG